MADVFTALSGVVKLVSLAWSVASTTWRQFSKPRSRRLKLYAEVTVLYQNVAGILKICEENPPPIEAGCRIHFVDAVKCPIYMELSSKVEEFTDVEDWKALQEVYRVFTRIPTAPDNEILDLARIAVTKFEMFLLEGKLNQQLVLKVATPKARTALEIVLRGDWSSVIDMNPRD
jgi:hypothetical protein